MKRLEHLGVLSWREGVVHDLAPQRGIELCDIAHAASQHDAVGIQGVDDLSQTSGQAVHIKIKTQCRLGLALPHGFNDELRRHAVTTCYFMLLFKGGPADPALKTIVSRAPARFASLFVFKGKRQGCVTPFPSEVIGACPDLLIEHDTASASSAKNDTKDTLQAARCAIDTLTQGQTIGVVF